MSLAAVIKRKCRDEVIVRQIRPNVVVSGGFIGEASPPASQTLLMFTRPLGNIDRFLIDTGTIDIDDTFFYSPGKVDIKNNDELIFNNETYIAKSNVFRSHGNYSRIIGRLRGRNAL